jgi:hypothetical protein
MATLNPNARADEAGTIRIVAAKAEHRVVTQQDNGDEALYL